MFDDLQQNACLDHIMLSSEDPNRLANFYASLLDCEKRPLDNSTWLCDGPDRRIIIGSGKNKALEFGAYRFSEKQALESLRERLINNRCELKPSPSPLFNDNAYAVDDPDGNTLVFGCIEESEVGDQNRIPARMQHLVVATDDIAPMVSFYTEVIGATLSDKVLDDKGDLTACFFRTDQEHHSFAVFRAPEKRLDHHSYEVRDWNDIRDWADRVTALEIPIEWGPGRHGAGNNLFLFVHDPDGNWVEFSAELDRVTPYTKTGTWKHEPRTLNLWGMAKMRS